MAVVAQGATEVAKARADLFHFDEVTTHLFLTCGASRAFPAPSAAVPVGQDAAAQGMPYHSTGSALSGDVFTKRNLSKNFGIQVCFKDILKKKMKYLHQL